MSRVKKLESWVHKQTPRTYLNWLIFGVVAFFLFRIMKRGSIFTALLPENEANVQGYTNLIDYGYNNTGVGSTNGEYAGDPDSAGTNSMQSIVKLADMIYSKTSGPNLIVYPEWVNRIANLSDSEILSLNAYWMDRYTPSLLGHLNGEWDGGYYAPAINRLQEWDYDYGSFYNSDNDTDWIL